jgi:hypothetical protein
LKSQNAPIFSKNLVALAPIDRHEAREPRSLLRACAVGAFSTPAGCSQKFTLAASR